MARMVPPDIIEEIKSRLDIVDIVSDHVEMRRTGRNFVGLCPFHSEKTPSFTVSQEKQIFHCFGCGKGGDVFTFYTAVTGSSFSEALETLAGLCGVDLPVSDRKSDDERDRITRVNELAMRAYHTILMDEALAGSQREYLASRSISIECMKDFKLGFAPLRWKQITSLLDRDGITEELLLKSGLVFRKREGGDLKDLFRNRIIFPIMDVRSRVIGFGGRSADGREPKYINSPETSVFSKGRNLYGLHLAKNEIRSRREAVVVEGYMDLLALYQAGCRHVVAPLGTALTQQQAGLLAKMCDTVFLMYDSDRAGRKAAFRAGDLLLATGTIAKYVELPRGEDPASYVFTAGYQAVENLMNGAGDIVDAKIAILRRRGGMKTVEGKRAAVGRVVDSLSGIENELMLNLYLERCSRELNVPMNVLSREIELRRGQRRRSRPAPVKVPVPDRKIHDLTERYLLLLLLTDRCDGDLFRSALEKLEENDFVNPEFREIFRTVRELAGKEGPVLDLVLNALDPERHSVVSSIVMDEGVLQNPEKMLEDCTKKLKERRIKRSLSEISDNLRMLSGSGQEKKADELAKEFYKLTRELSSLFPGEKDDG